MPLCLLRKNYEIQKALTYFELYCSHNKTIKFAVWKAVERNVILEHDLENIPLRIRTNTDLDYIQEKIWVKLFDSTDVEIGEIIIYVRQDPLFQIRGCMMSYKDIAFSLLSEINKEWTILKQPGPTLTVQCNDEIILEFLMSSSTCDVYGWKSNWSKEVTKFSDDDRASDFYESTALAGNVQFYYFSIHGRQINLTQ